MKKIYLVVLLVALAFQSALAQTKTTVFGNLGVENVNISIVNTAPAPMPKGITNCRFSTARRPSTCIILASAIKILW